MATSTKRAVISVYNKTGVVDLAKSLAGLGYELISTGGTFKSIAAVGVAVKQVSDVTQFPEILGGRVKTLHPAIHGGILAKKSDAAHQSELAKHQIAQVDLVVCNLYPFVETTQKANTKEADIIEEIDIGGVTLLRAAAKNFESVVVLSDPADYTAVVESLKTDAGVTSAHRKKLALKAFRHTATYDAAISTWFEQSLEGSEALPSAVNFSAEVIQQLRYGENPHQKGALYKWANSTYPFEQLQGKELSYNNILDIDAAWGCVDEFKEPACVIIKHLTPCGVATAANIVDAYKAAFESDTVSAFGGIIAVNREVDVALCEAIGSLFLEVLIARSFTEGAVDYFAKKKKNCRLMKVTKDLPKEIVVRSVYGGLLIQSPDLTGAKIAEWKVVSKAKPTEQQMQELAFAWIACKHVKSNAIVFAKGSATVGIGAGQPNRLDSVRTAGEHAGEKAKGAVMASDAFFPFADGVEAAAKFGIVAVVQPGGSVRDEDVIAAVDKLGLVMIFTGERHFRH